MRPFHYTRVPTRGPNPNPNPNPHYHWGPTWCSLKRREGNVTFTTSPLLPRAPVYPFVTQIPDTTHTQQQRLRTNATTNERCSFTPFTTWSPFVITTVIITNANTRHFTLSSSSSSSSSLSPLSYIYIYISRIIYRSWSTWCDWDRHC